MNAEALLRGMETRLRRLDRPVVEGRVTSLVGLALEVTGLACPVGEMCTIAARSGTVPAEVVGFRGKRALVMPYAYTDGIAPGTPVTADGSSLAVATGQGLLGRVLDPLGRPLDGGPPPPGKARSLLPPAADPMRRRPIREILETGVAVIDGLVTCGKGQRVGIFSGAGVGKSTLLGTMARRSRADVNVIALIGERGREVQSFVEDVLGPGGMDRSVVVVATGDAAPLLRLVGPVTAATIAEAFRDEGLDVLFLMDSVTRFAFAAREVGLSAGEPPTLRGYPPSFFARLPRLLERLGSWERGSITGFFTVLVEGDDLNEPVSDTLRGLLDGHVVLSRSLAARGLHPAVDPLASVSRLMEAVAGERHREAAARIRSLLALLEENRDLVQVGAYRKGTDPELDFALARAEGLRGLLHGGGGARSLQETLGAMEGLLAR